MKNLHPLIQIGNSEQTANRSWNDQDKPCDSRPGDWSQLCIWDYVISAGCHQ